LAGTPPCGTWFPFPPPPVFAFLGEEPGFAFSRALLLGASHRTQGDFSSKKLMASLFSREPLPLDLVFFFRRCLSSPRQQVSTLFPTVSWLCKTDVSFFFGMPWKDALFRRPRQFPRLFNTLQWQRAAFPRQPIWEEPFSPLTPVTSPFGGKLRPPPPPKEAEAPPRHLFFGPPFPGAKLAGFSWHRWADTLFSGAFGGSFFFSFFLFLYVHLLTPCVGGVSYSSFRDGALNFSYICLF